MIKLSDNIFPAQNVLDKLKDYQDEIDALPTFAERRLKAKKSFSAKNKNTNRFFNAVKEKLIEMCSGARRCVYCEDSVGDEVEHIRPKDFFPESCFVWENYVYACGNCNGPKNNKFAVYRDDNGEFYDVRQNPGAEPPKGKDAMINPRSENALDYCMLDLRDTFKFVNFRTPGTKEHKMAGYTFDEVLRLNEREFLRKARRLAFGNYKARLDSYNKQKGLGADQIKLNSMVDEIKGESHPTVWKEIKRYFEKGFLQSFDSDLHDLFLACPEALEW